MNYPHIHLLINHLPILGSMIGFLVIFSGLLLKSKITQRVGLIIVTFAAITALPTMFTGEEAEHALEKTLSIEESFFESHEEAAEIYIKIIIGAGIICLLAFLTTFSKSKIVTPLVWIALIAAGVAIGFSIEVGKTGGQIQHPEIRKIQTLLPATSPVGGEPRKDED